uniref:Zinc finger BED domain-containing protein RICESLEEPER 2-like n=1 Tax=Nicotiana tabacum TaxID=4097 RepID=A0A1S4CEB8_TOBAC
IQVHLTSSGINDLSSSVETSTHKGQDLASGVAKCLLEWGVDKVFTVIVDNANSNDVMVKELSKQFTRWNTNLMEGKHVHVRCMAHINNLVVQDGLRVGSVSVERIRQAIRYIRQSPARWKKFKECCDLDKITSKKSLCLDVPTRWNSTYLMLKVATVYEEAFTKYCNIDYGLMSCISNCICEDGQLADPLLSTDWDSVRRTVKFLEIFYELTLKVSGVKIQIEVKTYMKSLFTVYAKKNGDSGSSPSSPSSGSYPSSPSFPGSCPSSPTSSTSSSSLSKFMLDLKKHKKGEGIDSKIELDKYLGEDVEEDFENFNILGWWKLNSPRFPTLAEMTRDVLAIPISSVASESTFSTSGRILDPFRSSLTPRLVQALVCVQDWLRNESTTPVKIEEDLDNLEQLEAVLQNLKACQESGLSAMAIEVGTWNSFV